MADLCCGINTAVGSTSDIAVCTHKAAMTVGRLEIGCRVIARNKRTSISQIVLPFALYVVDTLLSSRVLQIRIAPNVGSSLVDVCGVFVIKDSRGDIRRRAGGQNVVNDTTATTSAT